MAVTAVCVWLEEQRQAYVLAVSAGIIGWKTHRVRDLALGTEPLGYVFLVETARKRTPGI